MTWKVILQICLCSVYFFAEQHLIYKFTCYVLHFVNAAIRRALHSVVFFSSAYFDCNGIELGSCVHTYFIKLYVYTELSKICKKY
jgi:hypothetical protein